MPYKLEKTDDGYYVVNEDTGKRHSDTPMSKSRATRQMRALYMAEEDKGKKKEIDLKMLRELFVTEKEHTGAMIALMLPEEAAQRLALNIDGALPSGELHITLAYLGDIDNPDLDKSDVMTAVGSFADYASPVKGEVSGVGLFMKVDEGGNAYYASFDSPQFPDCRQHLVEQLSYKNIPVAKNHGFIPHITLAYTDNSIQVDFEPFQITFDEISLVWGDERYDFKLNGYPPEPAIKESQLFVFKQDNGKHRWIMFSSNAFQDREKEIVSLKALEADVERADKEGNYGPLRWWHVGDPDPATKSPGPGIDLGTCDFNAMHGRILIESGTFKSERVGAAVGRKSADLSGSIGFFHPKEQPDKEGVFHNIHRFERSLLPKSRASNPFVSLLVTQKESDMQEQKIAELKSILEGDEDTISQVLSWAEQTEKEADKAGVSFKEFFTNLFKKEDKPEPDTATKEDEQEGDFVGDLSPAAFKELLAPTLKELIDPLAADLATFKDAQAKFENTQGAIKEAVDNQSASIKDIGERVKELEGETPRSAKGYRPSQDDETVVKDDSTVKDAAPGIDPEFINHFLTRGAAPGA